MKKRLFSCDRNLKKAIKIIIKFMTVEVTMAQYDLYALINSVENMLNDSMART